MKITCFDCKVDFEISKSGVSVIDQFLTPPQPYRILYGDLYTCPGCGARVISGYAEKALYHHEDNFYRELEVILKRAAGIKVYEAVSDVPEDERINRLTLSPEKIRYLAAGQILAGASVEEALEDAKVIQEMLQTLWNLERKYQGGENGL